MDTVEYGSLGSLGGATIVRALCTVMFHCAGQSEFRVFEPTALHHASRFELGPFFARIAAVLDSRGLVQAGWVKNRGQTV